VAPGEHPAREAARQLNIPIWECGLDAHGRVFVRREDGQATPNPDRSAPMPSDVALFLHTSGTTSRPKGVPLTHGNLMASIGNIAEHYRLSPVDTGLVVMPQFHVHGLVGSTLAPLFAGGTIVTPPRFSASGFWPVA